MSVQIQVRSDSSQAQADLKKLEGSLKAVQSSTESINRSIVSFSNIAKTAFAAIPLAIVGNNAVKTAASFEVLEQRLLTVTKSSIATAAAMGAVAKIVAKTPFSIRSLTDAYARLATTGNSLFKSQSQIERGIKNIADAVAAVAPDYPDTNFVAVDVCWLDDPAGNIYQACYKEHEGSFLVGMIAAMASESGISFGKIDLASEVLISIC